MKAIRIHRYGGTEELKLDEVPKPAPGDRQILVRIAAAGENPADWKIREGFLKEEMPVQLPYTPGYDIAGTIEQVGKGVDDLRVGDEVFGMINGGGYAEYALIYHNKVALKPKTVDLVQAASIPTAALTAWQALFETGNLQPGQTVLIHGAAGGVGSFAVQLAKWKNAKVIATCAGDSMNYVKELGADQIIDYQKERFEDKAGKIDLALDLIGGETLNRTYATVRKNGLLVSTVEEPSHEQAHSHAINVTMIYVHPKVEQLKRIAGLIDQGTLKTHVVEVLPLNEAAKAQELSRHGHPHGKIVLKVA